MPSSIYRATNTLTNKVYIGFATDFVKRLQRHKTRYKTTNTKFYAAIRKYGWDAFVWDIIYMSHDDIHCHQTMEQLFITEYDSIANGYNTTEGGLGVIGAVRNRIWVNNGIEHRRVLETDIPADWYVGRIGLQRTVRTRWTPNRVPRRSYAGSNNPAAKRISVNGVVFGTMKEAVESLGISEPTIRSRCRSSLPKFTDWFYLLP